MNGLDIDAIDDHMNFIRGQTKHGFQLIGCIRGNSDNCVGQTVQNAGDPDTQMVSDIPGFPFRKKRRIMNRGQNSVCAI